MTTSQRLRHWADNIETYGPNITQWGGIEFVVTEMRRMASEFDQLKMIEAAEEDYQAWKASLPKKSDEEKDV